MNNIDFWKAAAIRAFRTFLQVILTSIVAGLPEVQLADTLYSLDNDGEIDPDYDIEEDD